MAEAINEVKFLRSKYEDKIEKILDKYEANVSKLANSYIEEFLKIECKSSHAIFLVYNVIFNLTLDIRFASIHVKAMKRMEER